MMIYNEFLFIACYYELKQATFFFLVFYLVNIWDSVEFANCHMGLSKFNDLHFTKFQAQDLDTIQD